MDAVRISFLIRPGHLINSGIRNVFTAIKFLGIARFAETYFLVGLCFLLLQKLRPSLTAKRDAHYAYTKQRIDARIAQETDRRDFMTYVGIDGYQE